MYGPGKDGAEVVLVECGWRAYVAWEGAAGEVYWEVYEGCFCK